MAVLCGYYQRECAFTHYWIVLTQLCLGSLLNVFSLGRFFSYGVVDKHVFEPKWNWYAIAIDMWIKKLQCIWIAKKLGKTFQPPDSNFKALSFFFIHEEPVTKYLLFGTNVIHGCFNILLFHNYLNLNR